MLFFLTVLASPFFPQAGMVMDNSYFQETNEESDDEVTYLAYNDSQNPAGKFITISQDSSDDSDEEEDDDEKEASTDIEIEKPGQDDEEEAEIQETSARQITSDMDKEFGEMRMIQLADSIAGDMGIITKIRLER